MTGSSELTDLDLQVFQEVYKTATETGIEHIEFNKVAEKFVSSGIKKEEVNESLLILENRGLVRTLKLLEYVSSVSGSGLGFGKYVEEYRNDYYPIIDAVADKILQEGVKESNGIASSLKQTHSLILLVLRFFESKGYFPISVTNSGIYIGNPNIEFKRAYRKR